MRSEIRLVSLLALFTLIAGAIGEPPTAEQNVLVEGTVAYTGPLPRPIEVIEAKAQRHLVERDAKTKGLRDAVVWIEGAKAPAKRGDRKAAFVDQQNFFFVPHVVAVEAGQEVEFFNSDGANHGVHADSKNPRNCFNIITPPGMGHKCKFVASSEPVRIDCPLHAPMAAWVFVFDHPYFVVTGKDGSFKLPPLPPGLYTLNVRHASGGMRRKQPLEIKAGEPQRLAIEFGKDDLRVSP
jgi:plastocyanin